MKEPNIILPTGVKDTEGNPLLQIAREQAGMTQKDRDDQQKKDAEDKERYERGDVFNEEIIAQAEPLEMESQEELIMKERDEYDRISGELDALNQALQESSYLSVDFGKKFGVDFKGDKKVAEEWIQNRVKELEAKLRPKTSYETGEEFAKQYTELDALPEETPEQEVESTESALDKLKSTEEGMKMFELRTEAISLVKTFDELYTIINSFGEVPSGTSDRMYTAQEIIDSAEIVRSDPDNIPRGTLLTPTFGIQRKVFELARKEQGERKMSEEGIIPAESAETPSQAEGMGAENAAAFHEAYDRNKESGEKKSKWGWVKERLKGLVTFGYWEVHQAERFRSNTKEVGKTIEDQSEVLNQTRDLDIDVAHEEANRIREMVGENGMTIESITEASETIDQEKNTFNNQAIEKILVQAKGSVAEKLKKYKNEFGQGVVSDEKLKKFEDGLRNALLESTIGKGQRASNIVKLETNFKAEVRKNLDPKYWRRYVYAGVEAALMIAGFKLAIGKLAGMGFEQLATPSTGAEQISGGTTPGTGSVPGAESLPPSGTGSEVLPGTGTENIPMKDTIWNTSKEWLQQNGIKNPTNQDIMSLSKQVAIDNKIGVAEWNIPGSPMDTNMQQGHLLNFKGAKAVMAAINVARQVI